MVSTILIPRSSHDIFAHMTEVLLQRQTTAELVSVEEILIIFFLEKRKNQTIKGNGKKPFVFSPKPKNPSAAAASPLDF